MLTTEQEAREKWCPHVRIVEKWQTGNTHPRNRMVDMPAAVVLAENLIGCQCIASECAMWRWAPSENWVAFKGRQRIDKPCEEWVGYCGLAGRPE